MVVMTVVMQVCPVRMGGTQAEGLKLGPSLCILSRDNSGCLGNAPVPLGDSPFSPGSRLRLSPWCNCTTRGFSGVSLVLTWVSCGLAAWTETPQIVPLWIQFFQRWGVGHENNQKWKHKIKSRLKTFMCKCSEVINLANQSEKPHQPTPVWKTLHKAQGGPRVAVKMLCPYWSRDYSFINLTAKFS
jgi:hypothetical protein